MQKSFLKLMLCLSVSMAACPAEAVDVQRELLGPMPAAVLTSENDLKLLTPQLIRDLKKSGFAVDVGLCVKSPHDRQIGAVVPLENGKCCVWLNGKECPPYDQIRNTVKGAYKSREFAFSPDGRRLAYTARKGKKWMMVTDGKEGPEFDGLREPYFSPDSQHVCYVGFRGKGCVLVMDGKECGEYPAVLMSFPNFVAKTPLRVTYGEYCPVAYGPGGRFAFVASKGRAKNGADREVVVVDGKESAEYERVRGMEFSPDGKHVAFVAEKAGRMFVVLDGKPGAKYDDIDGMLTFSPDSKRLAYVATQYNSNADAVSFVVVDGKPGPKYPDIRSISVAFSSDSKHVSYTVTSGDGYRVVADGKAGKVYDEIGGNNAEACQMYAPDGRLYYKATKGDKCYMVVDGVQSQAYDDMVDPLPVLSRDGKHYAYVVRIGERWSVVQDGVNGPDYSNIGYGSPIPAGNSAFAYSATKLDLKTQVVVIDGKECANGDPVVMSEDGTRVAFMRDSGDWLNKAAVVVDGQEIGQFETVLDMSFEKDNTLTFLAVRDDTNESRVAKNLYRVRVPSAGGVVE